MSKLKQARLEIVKRVMWNHGIHFGDHCFMSLSYIAYHINNIWLSEYFLSPKQCYKYQMYDCGDDSKTALPCHGLNELFRGIRWCISDGLELRKTKTGSDYVAWKNPELLRP